jgi:thiol-disulfide isomerase/thioredoxin/NAD-dependent dihydropyrimidine dehydrogenase PreA subunit
VEGEIFTGTTKAVCVPGLNCYSCPGAAFACPLGSLQNALGSLNKNIGFYVLGIILLYAMLLGRTICGWLCPVGLIQELVFKLPTPKIKKNRLTRKLSYLKYIILAVFAIIIPVYWGLLRGVPVPGFCKYICPVGTLEGAIALIPANTPWLSMLGPIFTGKFIIMVAVLLACIFCYRSFCRFLCPLGAIYGLFNSVSIIGVKVDSGRCNNCGACVRNCKMDVKRVGDHECIHCAQCERFCRQQAIRFGLGKAKNLEKIFMGIAAFLLMFMLVWTNFLFPAAKGAQSTQPAQLFPQDALEEYESHAPLGFAAGERLPDFEIPCLDGSTFHLADTRGKVVFINLWGTYCTPCVQELPLFDALYREHREDVEVIAVHSSIITEDISAFLSDKGWTIPFAVDTEDDLVWKTVGGTSSMPQTIVIDPDGKVRFNRHGSVTKELLNTFYQQAKANDADT